MNKIIFTFTVFAAFFVLSCNNSNFKSPKNTFTAKEVAEMIKGDVLLVDVRNADEIALQSYDVKNIVNISLDSIEIKMNTIPKDKQVILVCQGGKRSKDAYDILVKKGFTNLANMDGGMNAWSHAGLPTKSNKNSIGSEKKACCANPNSKDCNPDGTCIVTDKTDEKACCSGDDQSDCATDESSTMSATTIDNKKNRLEVFAFHGTRQCETCKNMKANTKATLNKYFFDELKSGRIVFQIIDVDDAKNEKLAEKFQATGTALMINKVVNGKDNISDWSDFAFDKANEADAFVPELKNKIAIALK